MIQLKRLLPCGSLKLSKIVVADLQILGSAFCFGVGFLGQRALSVDGLGTMTCNALRFGLSTLFLVAMIPFMPPDPVDHAIFSEENEAFLSTSIKTKENSLLGFIRYIPFATDMYRSKNAVLFWGAFLGVINFCGSGFLQWGISKTSASKCAFIAGFDIFLTPILALFIPTLKPNGTPQASTWVAVTLSLMGLFLLSGSKINDFELGMGETLTLISTLFWTVHITYTDIATNFVDTISMICVQMGVVTLLSALVAIITEPRQVIFENVFIYFPWLLFIAVSEGLGFALMGMGQNLAPPTHAAIILSLEGVFATMFAYVVLGETLTVEEAIGCTMMLFATLLAEIGCDAIDKRFEIDPEKDKDKSSPRLELQLSKLSQA